MTVAEKSDADTVLVNIEDRIAFVTFNRPENAMR